ncbi:Histone Deacetylase 9 [Manis pentadactyla]|nr:Histone Deacetylase 9 [Manis pentadactyla]
MGSAGAATAGLAAGPVREEDCGVAGTAVRPEHGRQLGRRRRPQAWRRGGARSSGEPPSRPALGPGSPSLKFSLPDEISRSIGLQELNLGS